jgi:hypothetical protein
MQNKIGQTTDPATISLARDTDNLGPMTGNIQLVTISRLSIIIPAYNEEKTIAYFKYIRHEINQGKGAAIHTGIAKATGKYLLVQDADLKYVAYGSGFVDGHPHRILFFWQSTLN